MKHGDLILIKDSRRVEDGRRAVVVNRWGDPNFPTAVFGYGDYQMIDERAGIDVYVSTRIGIASSQQIKTAERMLSESCFSDSQGSLGEDWFDERG